MIRGVVFLSMLGFVAACASTPYRYAPVSTTSAEVDGRPAVEAAIPSDAPTGSIRIVPLGIAPVTPPPESGQRPFDALYVRMLVDNRSTEAWTVDVANQVLVTKWRGNDWSSRATTATGARAPIIAIEPNSGLAVELLFELPPGATKAADVAAFDVAWTVRSGARPSSGKASFQRLSAEPGAALPVKEDLPPPQRGPGRYSPEKPR